MNAAAPVVRDALKRSGLRLCPLYGPEGLAVRPDGEHVLVRAMGPAQTMLAEAATVALECAGYAVEPAPRTIWDNVFTNLRISRAV